MAEGKRRRSTDYEPLSKVVTRDNLDDRLDTVDKKTMGHWALDDERWSAHKELATERWTAHREVHSSVAESLRDYKRDANEWRTTLADLRGTFIPKAEYQAEHRALEAKLHGEVERAVAGVVQLDSKVDGLKDDIKTVANDLKAGLALLSTEKEVRRGLFADSRNVILVAIAVVGVALAIWDRLPIGK